MPPLAYARFPKTVKRKLVEPPKKMAPANKMAFKYSGLRPPRRSGSSYTKKLLINPKQKTRTWPALMIQRSTRIFGEIPVDNDYRKNQYDMSRPGYFFEKSEVEISPMNNIFREKRYSIKAFFDDLSRKAFSRHGTRFRRETSGEQDKDEEVEGFDQAENVSRLLAILARNYRATDKTEEDPVRKEIFGHRSKRQVSREEEDVREEFGERDEEERKEVSVDSSKKRNNGRGKSKYTPVFKECNDTAASEISDLNAPPPPPERRSTLQGYSRNGAPLITDIDFTPKKNPSIINRVKNEDSEIPPSVAPAVNEENVGETPKETAMTSKHIQNGTYINLQDHQKGTQDGNGPKDANGYPLDIPPYNPDVIPYVDVPDYSDQREESLDKDDRRVAKEKYVEYPDEDADVIDPGLQLRSDEPSVKITGHNDGVSDNDEAAEGPNESKSRGAEEVKEDEVEEEDEESGNSRVSNDNENTEEEKESGEKSSKDLRKSESDDAKDFEPIHFDINEYKKPFDLEELFKDIEKEAQKAQDKNKTKIGDVNEHQSSKNIPVRDGSHEVISGASGKYQNDGELTLLKFADPGKKENHGNRDDNKKRNAPQDATIAPPNFFEEFERVFGPAVSEKPLTGYFDTEDDKEGLSGSSAGLVENEDEKYPYGDVDTYERLFGTGDEGDKSEDGDYYKQHSSDDVADFHGEKKKPETETEEPTDESLREAYKTLATILDRKDDISRLDDEAAQKAKKEGKMPAKYNNHWTLEYGTPIEEGKT